jgi:uncharacterized protein (TIGR02466 family)
MSDITTYSLFPKAVYQTNINRKLTKKEINFINDKRKNVTQNEGNITSKERYIFENEIMKKLHDECLSLVNSYIQQVICPKYDVSPYITQSWLNYTEPGQFHHRHSHANSYLSGVMYINAEEEDKIHFYNSIPHEHIKLVTENYNLYNSESWWVPVRTGDIVVFPSSIQHMVTNTESKNTRISLAFNTFLKGTIGDGDSLTELLIK